MDALQATGVGAENIQPEQTLGISGKSVLLVEDEYYIADDIARTLKAAGALIVGPCSSLARAQAFLDGGAFDCALIDLNLHGESAVPIADQLVKLNKPFAITTGYASSAVPNRMKKVPRIEKPFDPPALIEVIAELFRADVTSPLLDHAEQPQDEDQDQ